MSIETVEPAAPATTPLTLGSFVELGLNGQEVDIAIAVLRVYQNHVAPICRRCERTQIALVSCHPRTVRHAAGPSGDDEYDLCDECFGALALERTTP